MPGKKQNKNKNGQAHDAWVGRKREFNALGAGRQKAYRMKCLNERTLDGRLTVKNEAEIGRVFNEE